MSERQTFKVQIENGEIQDAQVLAVVTIDNKDYAIYTINKKNGKSDVLASCVEQDAEGYDVLKDIEKEEDKYKITQYIKGLLK